MLTLMNMDESVHVPLYMASILNIIRQMAVKSARFNYKEFKQIVAREDYTRDQRNMLDMRLDLLESFLDLDGKHTGGMEFKSGEVTIMDLSCPFIDTNTACVMFKCGLQRYLQSKASGKLVVLDEAHKVHLRLCSHRSHSF